MTMACKQIQDLLGKFRDKELHGREYQEVAEHLKGCIHCSDEMRKLDTVGLLLKNHYETVSAAADFSGMWDRISTRLDAGAEVIPFRRRFAAILHLPKPVWATIGAAAAAVLILLAYIPGTQEPAVAANDCIIDKVAADDNSVIVYETDKTKMKIIWVLDRNNGERGETEKGVTS